MSWKEKVVPLPTQVPYYYMFSVKPSSKAQTVQDTPVGLENLGETCWFNVVVQLLYHIPKFRYKILNFKGSPADLVTSGLRDLFAIIKNSDSKLIIPADAVTTIGKLIEGGEGQQDACEYLGVLLNRIRDMSPEAVEELFVGTCTSSSTFGIEEFLLYTLPTSQSASSLLLTLQSQLTILKPILAENFAGVGTANAVKRHSFVHLPPVFLIDICYQGAGMIDNPNKENYPLTFPSVIFMDRFLLDNADLSIQMDTFEESNQPKRDQIVSELRVLQDLKKKLLEVDESFKTYRRFSDVTEEDSKNMVSLHNQLLSKVLSRIQIVAEKLEHFDREKRYHLVYPTLRPYQLHAILVHCGAMKAGHYKIYVWDSQCQTWFLIEDNDSSKETWDEIVKEANGGIDQQSSPHCLVYLDALKTQDLLGLKPGFEFDTDVLRYLKDPTDLRTRHASYSKSQTFQALSQLEAINEPDPTKLLFQAINYERERLHRIYHDWLVQPDNVQEEHRLRHFVIYLLANQVAFEPHVYWSLLQQFSISAIQAKEKTNAVCLAARHALAYIENSTTQDEKTAFIRCHTSYHQFRLIARHLMSGINHLTNQNFAAAVPLAIKALYLHCDIIKGPPSFRQTKSLRPEVIHALIEKSLSSLSAELLATDLGTCEDVVCTVLLDGIINWCVYADVKCLGKARMVSRSLLEQWGKRLQMLNLSGDTSPVLEKLREVEKVLRSTKIEEINISFQFKGHIPDNLENGEKLAQKWNQILKTALEGNVLNIPSQ